MPHRDRLESLQKRSLEQFPNLTQLLRSLYHGLGAQLPAAREEGATRGEGATNAAPVAIAPTREEGAPNAANTQPAAFPQATLTEKLGLNETYRAICVVLIDGMGLEQLQACRAHTPFLRSQENTLLAGHTVLPSTTATALTSFTTGAFPAQTNMFGWSVQTAQGLGNLINFQNIGLPPQQWQPVEPLFQAAKTQFGIDTQVISHPRFASSGLTEAAFRGATFVGAESFDARVAAGIRHLQRGRGLAYLYWSELDHIGHMRGWQSLDWVAELEQVDAKLRALAAACPADAALVLTADHGMVDVDPRQRIDLAECPQLARGVTALAGEGRCVQLHTAPGETPAVLAAWQDFFGAKALLTTVPDAVFRGRPSAHYTADALVFSLENQVIVDSRVQPPGQVNLVGVHGSVTEAELAIPMWRLA